MISTCVLKSGITVRESPSSLLKNCCAYMSIIDEKHNCVKEQLLKPF